MMKLLFHQKRITLKRCVFILPDVLSGFIMPFTWLGIKEIKARELLCYPRKTEEIMDKNQEPVTQTVENTEVPVTEPVVKTEAKGEEKTFTQEEVNAMILKAQKKMPSKEEMQAFNEWKESQKTEAEKQTELTQKIHDTENENVSLKQEIQVLRSGVNADDVDYVLFKVSKMEGDFEDNLNDFLKDNPKYLQSTEVTEPANKDTGIPVTKVDGQKENGVTAILKNKHPELFKN